VKKVDFSETGLFSQVPHLKDRWNWTRNTHLDPSKLSKGSEKRAWWICERGHEFEKQIFNMVRSGCPYCSNRAVLAGYNDLATVRPDLALEFDVEKNGGRDPSSYLAGTATKVWWKCDKGHSFQAKVSNRKFSNSSCPYCVGLFVIPGLTDLASKFPDAASTWDKHLNKTITPDSVSPGSEKKAWWKCPKGHSWQMRIKDRVIHRQGCSVCANHQIIRGVNDLASIAPEIAKTLAPDLNPTDFAYTVGTHSGKRAWWKCAKGHVYESPVKRRHQSGCPVCAGQKVLPGVNDLETQNPDAAAHFLQGINGISPSEVLVSSRVSYFWECDSGHQFKAHPDSVSKGNWCPYCGNKKLLKGFNDLITRAPEIAAEWHPELNGAMTAGEVIYGSHSKYWWKCARGHEFQQSIKKRRTGQGCPSCAKTGFNPSIPGLVYVLVHDSMESLKVGITNTDNENRLKLLASAGWRKVRDFRFTSGSQAERVEKQFFQVVRGELRIPIHLDSSRMKRTGGWSETMSRDLIGELRAIAIIEDILKKTDSAASSIDTIADN